MPSTPKARSKAGRIVAAVAMMVLMSISCLRSDSNEKTVLARVGTQTLTLEEFERDFGQRQESIRGDLELNDQAIERARSRSWVKNWAERNLVRQELLRRGVELTSDEGRRLERRLRRMYPISSYRRTLAERHSDPLSWQRAAGERLLLLHKVSEELGEVEISEEKIAEYYEEHKEQFSRPEVVIVDRLVLPSRAQAIEVRDMALKGAEFHVLAEKYGMTTKATSGFTVQSEVLAVDTLRPEVREQINEMAAGEISQPLARQGVFELLKLVARNEEGVTSLDDVRDQIRGRLAGDAVRDTYETFLETARKNIKPYQVFLERIPTQRESDQSGV